MSKSAGPVAARLVQGETGASYRLAAELGRGGQGRVFRVRGGQFAVKLLQRSSARQSQMRAALRAVRRLPLEDLPIALPLEFLRAPDIGYVMELLTELRPLGWLLAGRPGVNLADWYY